MENIDLIRKIAWSFHRTTGLEWDDLFQEAALAYCEGLKRYTPEHGKITTFMWHTITTHLKNYLRKQEYRHFTNSIEEIPVRRSVNGTPLFEILSQEAQQVVKVILDSPMEFDRVKTNEDITRMVKKLRLKLPWKRIRIRREIKNLQVIFS